jgi:hypothetical protein
MPEELQYKYCKTGGNDFGKLFPRRVLVQKSVLSVAGKAGSTVNELLEHTSSPRLGGSTGKEVRLLTWQLRVNSIGGNGGKLEMPVLTQVKYLSPVGNCPRLDIGLSLQSNRISALLSAGIAVTLLSKKSSVKSPAGKEGIDVIWLLDTYKFVKVKGNAGKRLN